MRRLLLLPAFALALVGTPVLALQQPEPASSQPTVDEVPLPAAQDGTVQPGFQQEVPVQASLVGVTWTGDPNAEFGVETRDPSGAWAPAETLGADDTGADPNTPDGRNVAGHPEQATEPLWVKDATAVRVTLEQGSATDIAVSAVSDAQSSAPSGSAGAAGALLGSIDGPERYGFGVALLAIAGLLTFLAAGRRPRRRADRRVRRSKVGLAVLALAVVTLAACRPIAPPPPPPPPPPPGPDPTCGTVPTIAPKLSFGVVHHTVNSNGYTAGESAQIVRNIQAYHMNTLHYCDIAYNFLVDQFGQIFEGRAGGIDQAVVAAHTGGFNTGSTGVAVIGDFSNVGVSQPVFDQVIRLLSWKVRGVHGVNPADPVTLTSGGGGSRWPEGQQVSFANSLFGHRDLWPTACPGQVFFNQLGNDQWTLVNAVNADATTQPAMVTRAQWGAVPFGG